MKKLIYSLVAVVCAISMSSCHEYYHDGGLHNPYVNMTTTEFLAQHPKFDSTIQLINAVPGMKAILDGNNTFFAPMDFAINYHVRLVNGFTGRGEYTFDSLKAAPELERFLKQYIVEGIVTRDEMDLVKLNTVIDHTTHINMAGDEVAVYLLETSDNKPQTSEYPTYVYYNRKHGNEWDPIDFATMNDAVWRAANADDKVQVSTSGIITKNGVIHVLSAASDNHAFGFVKSVNGYLRY